jgi:hypothetical protein
MQATGDNDRFSARSLVYDGADEIVEAEAQHLLRWRGQEPQVGLALSGGGIRSASYCLGVLQALAYRGALPNIDYLSTVSGGGYIGASLTYLLHQSASGADTQVPMAPPAPIDVSKEYFPYVSYPMVGVGAAKHPVRTQEQRRDERLKGRLLRRLRQGSNYLVPGDGITLLSLTGVVVRNLAAGVAVHVAVLVALFQLLFMGGWFGDGKIFQRAEGGVGSMTQFPPANGLLVAAGCLLAAYVLMSMATIPLTRVFDMLEKRRSLGPYLLRRAYEVLTHWLFALSIALLVVGGLPWLHQLMVDYQLTSPATWLQLLGKGDNAKPAAAGILATAIGVIGNLWGLLQARSGKKPRIPTGLVVAVASAALFVGLLLLVYVLTGWLYLDRFKDHPLQVLGAACTVLVVFGWLPEANYLSLHRFYRDRLLELFLPDLKRMHQEIREGKAYLPLHRFLWDRLRNVLRPHNETRWSVFHRQFRTAYARVAGSRPGDTTLLGDLCGAPLSRAAAAASTGGQPTMPPDPTQDKRLRGPYHILNANVVLVASQHPRYRPRGGDNFIFSPLFCGSRATGWAATNPTPENGFTLATAMAVSGAAVNPNAGPGGEGVTRQPVLSVLMGLLNLRLGYWVRNPKRGPGTDGPGGTRTVAANPGSRIDWVKPNPIFPGMLESFGRFDLNEYARYLLLTDGGHFENMGLYELVRRRLKLIIVCDATADPDFKFTDLSNAIQKVRADFGAIIDIDAEQLATLTPRRRTKTARADTPGDATDQSTAGPSTAQRPFLIVPIRYSVGLVEAPAKAVAEQGKPRGKDPEHEVGTLILLKATPFEGMSADLFSYRSEHPRFPNQGTTDQFFDERQFDAYRELGYMTAYRMLRQLHARATEPPAAPTCPTRSGYQAPSEQAVARLLFGLGRPVGGGAVGATPPDPAIAQLQNLRPGR